MFGVEKFVNDLAGQIEADYLLGNIEVDIGLDQESLDDCREKLSKSVRLCLNNVPKFKWNILAEDIESFLNSSPQKLCDIVRMHQDLGIFDSDDSPIIFQNVAMIIRELSKKEGHF